MIHFQVNTKQHLVACTPPGLPRKEIQRQAALFWGTAVVWIGVASYKKEELRYYFQKTADWLGIPANTEILSWLENSSKTLDELCATGRWSRREILECLLVAFQNDLVEKTDNKFRRSPHV